MADNRCPHCDHVFALDEITDEWCASCGKHIPEAFLKDLRPKPHLRKPHPDHPPKTPAAPTHAPAPVTHETKVRVAGLVMMVASCLGGLAALTWGTFSRLNGSGIAGAVAVGAAAAIAFVIGLVMLNAGGAPEE